MDLTIIIVNWNAGEMLCRCLRSIASSRCTNRVDVIVVDNASSDGSREMVQAEFPTVKLVDSGANLGFGKANNLARRHVTTPLVLFLNPDTEVLEDSLRVMIEFMESHPQVGALGCKMKLPDGSVHDLGLQWFPTPWTEFLRTLVLSGHRSPWLDRWLPQVDPEAAANVSKLYGGCLLARKEVLDAVGWFDERFFMYAEDVDLCRKIRDRGAELYYLPAAEVIHVAGGTSRKARGGFSTLMMCESIAKLMHKYYGTNGKVLYRLAIFSAALGRLAALGLVAVVRPLLPRFRNRDLGAAAFKYALMLQWSLKFKKPVIPTHS